MLASISGRSYLSQRGCIAAVKQQTRCNNRRAGISCRVYQLRRVVAAAATTETSDPVVVSTETPASTFRKYFTSLGWEKAWVDVVTDRLVKCDPKPTEEQVGAVVLLLKDVGIPMQSICNMSSITYEMLTVPVAQAKQVVDYCKKRGVSGQALVTLLEAHPKLLTYEVAAAGDKLAKGKTLAQVDVVTMNGQQKAIVSMWRQGAAFSSPVAPMKPNGL